MFHKNSVIVFALVLLFVPACSSSPASPINMTADGLAIKGYDPVAYFLEGKPRKGSKEYEYVWMGAVWRLASAQNLKLFEADPRRYAPQYGGY